MYMLVARSDSAYNIAEMDVRKNSATRSVLKFNKFGEPGLNFDTEYFKHDDREGGGTSAVMINGFMITANRDGLMIEGWPIRHTQYEGLRSHYKIIVHDESRNCLFVSGHNGFYIQKYPLNLDAEIDKTKPGTYDELIGQPIHLKGVKLGEQIHSIVPVTENELNKLRLEITEYEAERLREKVS